MILKTHGTQPLPGLISAPAVAESLKEISSHLHVLFGRETAEEVMALKNHADSAAQLLALTPPGSPELLSEHAYITLLDLSERTDQRQQSGLSTT